MQRRQPDHAYGTAHAAAALDPDAVDVVVLSADEALMATLQEATGTTNTLWHAPTIDAAVDLLVGGHCSVFIADLTVLHTDASALFERLHAQFPELVLLAAGRRDEESAVAGLISKGHVYRFLHKPVSPARANLFLAAATRRYRDLVPSVSPARATVRHLARPANRGTLVLGLGVVAALALVSVGVVMMDPFSRKPSAALAVASSTPASMTQVATPSVDILASAKRALAEDRIAPPAQDNALDQYRALLAAQPDNAEAKSAIEEILLTLEERVTQALQARDAAAAARALAALRQAQPDHIRLASLSEQVVQLSRAISTDAALKTVPAKIAPPPVIAPIANAPNLKLARARLASGQWLEPEGDSALSYLREARAHNEDNSVITILATDLGARLLDESRAAIAADNAPQARAHFNNAISLDREFDLALPGLLDAGKALDEITTREANRAANQIRDLLAPAIKLRESGQLIEPAGNNAYEIIKSVAAQYADAPELRAEQQRLAFTLLDHARTALAAGNLDLAQTLSQRADELVPRMSATQTLRQQVTEALAQRTAATSVINAGSLRRTREIPANYPADAQRRGIQGWVDLEFTVAADGSTRDVIVTSAQPQDAFDKAAIDAMRRWRFEPVMRNGAPVDQRARLRMQFTLE